MSEYIFLYRGGEAGRSPEKMQQTMQKWVAWLKGLAEKGHVKDQGQPLERTGKLVKGKQKTVTDGPFAEAKDIVGGYTLIEARDLEQAVKLARSPMERRFLAQRVDDCGPDETRQARSLSGLYHQRLDQFDGKALPRARRLMQYQRDEPLGFGKHTKGAANQLDRLPLFDFRTNKPAQAIILKCE
jgi:hypothetical protein